MKKTWKYFFYLALANGFCNTSQAQTADSASLKNNLKRKTIAVKDSVFIDSLSTAQQSFRIKGISDTAYLFLPEQSLLIWKHKPEKDSIQIQYRTIPLSFNALHYHKKLNEIDSNIAFPIYTYAEQNKKDNSGFVHFKSINYSGTYGRSLTLGNNQDVSLNSNFNLQLNGYILDSISIEAALSDNKIPVQPDGNTARLQQFDKIYVTFQKGLQKLTAGDYILKKPSSYFMNFDKRVQGLYFQGAFPINKNIKNKIGLSGSIAKGEFARNSFNGKEGNQGPYKLTGNNGEQFIIILAGTEKVYLNGRQIQRGENRDYTIDYNTGEITFMPRRMITKDARIQVEFEYRSRNYLNSLFYCYDDLKIKNKWHLKFNAYSNQDAKNQSYLQNLTGQQKRFLSSIGDRINDALYPSMEQDTFAENKILYRLTDTTVDGIYYDSVFVYAANQDSVLYTLNFSNVGQHKGNYIISGENTNGRSYKWIAPANGKPQGSYAPYVLLITPKQQQMFTLDAEYQIDRFQKIGIAAASSHYVPNLFSKNNKAKHWGFAGKGFYNGTKTFGKKDSAGKQNWIWHNNFSYEWTQNRFKAIAPYRNIEFNRDWNLNDSTNNNAPDENLINFKTDIKRNNWGMLSYQLTRLQKGNIFQGNRNLINLTFDHNNYRGGGIFNLMHAKDTIQKSNFSRPSAFFEKTFPKLNNITLGAKWEAEHNEIRLNQNNNLSPAAFANNTIGIYLKNDISAKNSIHFQYKYRTDKKPVKSDFINQSKAYSFEATLNINQWKKQQITFTGAYRKLMTNDTSPSHPENDNQNILARLQYNGTILKGFLIPAILYEIGSGQQQKQEYVYVKVPAGQGIYMWIDYNHDSVQQVNEFETAIYSDQKQYIRMITPTNDYVGVHYTRLNQNLYIRPENLWRKKKKKGWQVFLTKFSNQFSLQIDNKSLAKEGLSGFNPFTKSIADEDIIANSANLFNMLYFNQSSSVWSIHYDFRFHSVKSLLIYGQENQRYYENRIVARLNFLKNFTGKMQAGKGIKNHVSAVPNDGRTYYISEKSFQPELCWTKAGKCRIEGSYHWRQRHNRFAYGNEKAAIQSVKLEMRISFPKSGIINISGTYTHIRYNGASNTPLSFIILDALKPGRNWLWHISWQRNIGRGIQISLNYNGRKPASSTVIHTGTMSIRALL